MNIPATSEVHCSLIWRTNNNRWLEQNAICNVIVTKISTTFRNSETSLIMADFNNQCIRFDVDDIKIIKVIMISSNEVCLAFKLIDMTTTEFKSILENLDIQHINSDRSSNSTTLDETSILPDLKDEESQRLILKLLFNDSFHEFVDDLEIMLDALTDVIDSRLKQ